MPATDVTTRIARADELEQVIALSLAAFADEVVTAWVIPDPERRAAYMRDMLGASLAAVIDEGIVILAEEQDGTPIAASIWVPRGSAPDVAPDAPAADDPETRRIAIVEAATQARRPAPAHLHLSSMATLPEYRGRGAGRAMLAAGREQARRSGLPVYLEASTSDNRRLYDRFGFRASGEPIHLPDGGPTLQPMWLDAEPPFPGELIIDHSRS